MHSQFHYSKTFKAYNYDYSLDRAIWAIALVHYWCTHAFHVANCNGFYFNACPLGLTPVGRLCLSMVLYDPRTLSYVNNNANIYLTQYVMSKFCTFFSPLCTLYNHIFDTNMPVVSPVMSIFYKIFVYIYILIS